MELDFLQYVFFSVIVNFGVIEVQMLGGWSKEWVQCIINIIPA